MNKDLTHQATLWRMKRFTYAGLATALIFILGPVAFGQDEVNPQQYGLNNLLLLISGALVFWMHAGFAMLEAGLTQAKNTVNILAKNVAVVAISGVTYYLIGFNLMYPGEFNMINGALGFAGFEIANVTPANYADGA